MEPTEQSSDGKWCVASVARLGRLVPEDMPRFPGDSAVGGAADIASEKPLQPR